MVSSHSTYNKFQNLLTYRQTFFLRKNYVVSKYILHCDVTSMIFNIIQSEIFHERSKIMNFYKRSFQPILRYLYTETIKCRGEISLHRHFNGLKLTCSCLLIAGNLAAHLSRSVY